jgi:hypothetical protein
MRFRALCLGLLFITGATARPQEVDCTVQVNTQSLTSDATDKLRDFASNVKAYVSNYNWGQASATDKVRCTIDIFFTSITGENGYNAQIFIGSQRPIFQSDQSTAVVRLIDGLWQFEYLNTIPLVHNPYVFNSLTSTLDFYMHLIIGMDYDTYDRLSGTPMLEKAYQIANLGRSAGARDWQVSTSGYTRMQYIEELMNPKFEPVRSASWLYHFCGMDSLTFDRERGQRTMLRAIEQIGAVKKQVDVRNLVIKAFFDVKYQEIAATFADFPDPNVYITFSRIDPANQTAYEAQRQKRR